MLHHLGAIREPARKGLVRDAMISVGYGVEAAGSALYAGYDAVTGAISYGYDAAAGALGDAIGLNDQSQAWPSVSYAIQDHADRLPSLRDEVARLVARIDQLATDPSTGQDGDMDRVQQALGDKIVEIAAARDDLVRLVTTAAAMGVSDGQMVLSAYQDLLNSI